MLERTLRRRRRNLKEEGRVTKMSAAVNKVKDIDLDGEGDQLRLLDILAMQMRSLLVLKPLYAFSTRF